MLLGCLDCQAAWLAGRCGPPSLFRCFVASSRRLLLLLLPPLLLLRRRWQDEAGRQPDTLAARPLCSSRPALATSQR